MSVLPWFGAILGSVGFAGGTDAVSSVAFQNIAQRRTPDAVRSRVMGAIDALVTGGLALSFVAAGPFVAAVGPRGAYAAAGISSLIGGAILFPALWGRRRGGAESLGEATADRRAGGDRDRGPRHRGRDGGGRGAGLRPAPRPAHSSSRSSNSSSSRIGMPSFPVSGMDGFNVRRASSTAPGRSAVRRKPRRW